MKLGTTVEQWFEMIDSSGASAAWIAEHVPNAVPDWFVSAEPLAAAVDVATRA